MVERPGCSHNIVLCVNSECVFPGLPTIPEQIVANRAPYFDALDAADEAYKQEKLNVSAMEELLAEMLAQQLKNAYEGAGGKL